MVIYLVMIIANRGLEDGFIRTIGIEEAIQKFDEGTWLFFDARATPFYNNSHIHGAVSITHEYIEKNAIEFERVYSKKSKIVVYCDGAGCSSSYDLAKLLKDLGYKDTEVFFEGWNKWTRAGYPIDKDGV